tara:strand:- start:130 stop:372 length:243 start_codon:yes stop_codon:yes gene_type:complete
VIFNHHKTTGIFGEQIVERGKLLFSTHKMMRHMLTFFVAEKHGLRYFPQNINRTNSAENKFLFTPWKIALHGYFYTIRDK